MALRAFEFALRGVLLERGNWTGRMWRLVARASDRKRLDIRPHTGQADRRGRPRSVASVRVREGNVPAPQRVFGQAFLIESKALETPVAETEGYKVNCEHGRILCFSALENTGANFMRRSFTAPCGRLSIESFRLRAVSGLSLFFKFQTIKSRRWVSRTLTKVV